VGNFMLGEKQNILAFPRNEPLSFKSCFIALIFVVDKYSNFDYCKTLREDIPIYAGTQGQLNLLLDA
jgi:hypothetical protein